MFSRSKIQGMSRHNSRAYFGWRLWPHQSFWNLLIHTSKEVLYWRLVGLTCLMYAGRTLAHGIYLWGVKNKSTYQTLPLCEETTSCLVHNTISITDCAIVHNICAQAGLVYIVTTNSCQPLHTGRLRQLDNLQVLHDNSLAGELSMTVRTSLVDSFQL